MTLAVLTTFDTSVEQFKADVPTVKSTIKESSTENAQYKALITQALTIIQVKIGGTLFHIKDKIVAVYAGFVKASTIQKPPTTPTQLLFTCIDDGTNQPLEGVKITDITIQPVKTNVVAKLGKRAKPKKIPNKTVIPSTIMGEVLIKKGATKIETVEITREGYQPLQVTLTKPQRGKVNPIEVRLIPIVV